MYVPDNHLASSKRDTLLCALPNPSVLQVFGDEANTYHDKRYVPLFNCAIFGYSSGFPRKTVICEVVPIFVTRPSTSAVNIVIVTVLVATIGSSKGLRSPFANCTSVYLSVSGCYPHD